MKKNCGKRNAEKLKEHLDKIETLEGNFSQLGFWKIKQKLCPKAADPPMAKIDENGTLVTTPTLLKNLYLRTYSKRLQHKIMKPELNGALDVKTELVK